MIVLRPPPDSPVKLGSGSRMQWNDQGKWIYSEEIAHPLIIDDVTFGKAQDLLTARRGMHGERTAAGRTVDES